MGLVVHLMMMLMMMMMMMMMMTMMMMMLRLVLISDISDKDVAKHKELIYMRRCRSKAARGVRACAGDCGRGGSQKL